MATKKSLNINAAPAIKKLEILARSKMRTGLLGSYVSVFKGVSGLEFDGYRGYNQDDDASVIDWKASARAKQILVKEHIQTRELEVFFLIDVSTSMIFGSAEKLKNEYAAELALAMTYVILANGDKVGYALFNHDIVTAKRPSRGIMQFIRLSMQLTNAESYGGGFDIIRALEFTDTFIKKKGTMLIIISDFIGEKKDWLKKLKITSQKFDTIALMVRDLRDSVLPKDISEVLVENPYANERLLIDSELISNFYEAYVKLEENELKEIFLKQNINFLKLTTDRDFVAPLVNLFSRRRT